MILQNQKNNLNTQSATFHYAFFIMHYAFFIMHYAFFIMHFALTNNLSLRK